MELREFGPDDEASIAEYVAIGNAILVDAPWWYPETVYRQSMLMRHVEDGEVSRYFGNYSQTTDWQLVPGLVDRRPAIIVHDPARPSGPPIYFLLLDWAGDRLLGIRDFRYARYAVEDAELIDFP